MEVSCEDKFYQQESVMRTCGNQSLYKAVGDPRQGEVCDVS